jgi:hypothetical protein
VADLKLGTPRSASPFDRLYGPRRNKRFRNIALITAGAAGFMAVVLLLDAEMSGQPLMARTFLALGLVSFLSTGLSIYFHMKFLSRD